MISPREVEVLETSIAAGWGKVMDSIRGIDRVFVRGIKE